MANRVFFSFHYQDVIDLRANVVRNHGLTKNDSAGFFDASLWENAKRTGGLKRLINDGLHNTSVTCVLIGSETYARPWVRYELLKSFRRGNKLLGIHINSIKGRDQRVKPRGPDPLASVGVTFSADGQMGTLWEFRATEWVKYTEIDGSADYATNVSAEHRGKGYNFTNFYWTYDWVADDGFNNFATWVG